MTNRTRLLVFWDFQNVGVAAKSVQDVSRRMRAALQGHFGGELVETFKAFGGTNQSAALEELSKLGWRARPIDDNVDDKLIAEAKSVCGQNPEETVFVLISGDTGYSGLISDLQGQGVDVHLLQLLGPTLRNAVGGSNVIDIIL